jgi:hypothetical protein
MCSWIHAPPDMCLFDMVTNARGELGHKIVCVCMCVCVCVSMCVCVYCIRTGCAEACKRMQHL